MSFETYLNIGINAFVTGAGAGVGTYLVNRFFIKKSEAAIKQMRKQISALQKRVQ